MESADAVMYQLLESVGDTPIVSGLTILVLFTLIQNFILFRKLRALLRGGDGKSLEGTIKKLGERVESIEAHAKEMTLILKEADERLGRSVQGISVKRFDPFQNAGGQRRSGLCEGSEEVCIGTGTLRRRKNCHTRSSRIARKELMERTSGVFAKACNPCFSLAYAR